MVVDVRVGEDARACRAAWRLDDHEAWLPWLVQISRLCTMDRTTIEQVLPVVVNLVLQLLSNSSSTAHILWPRYNSLSYGGTAYFPITSGARPRPRRASSSRHQEASRCWA